MCFQLSPSQIYRQITRAPKVKRLISLAPLSTTLTPSVVCRPGNPTSPNKKTFTNAAIVSLQHNTFLQKYIYPDVEDLSPRSEAPPKHGRLSPTNGLSVFVPASLSRLWTLPPYPPTHPPSPGERRSTESNTLNVRPTR